MCYLQSTINLGAPNASGKQRSVAMQLKAYYHMQRDTRVAYAFFVNTIKRAIRPRIPLGQHTLHTHHAQHSNVMYRCVHAFALGTCANIRPGPVCFVITYARSVFACVRACVRAHLKERPRMPRFVHVDVVDDTRVLSLSHPQHIASRTSHVARVYARCNEMVNRAAAALVCAATAASVKSKYGEHRASDTHRA